MKTKYLKSVESSIDFSIFIQTQLMNRLILVGNGFDLAHGLKTSYNDFIDDFWSSIVSTMTNSANRQSRYYKDDVIKVENTDSLELSFLSRMPVTNFETFKQCLQTYNYNLSIHNRFFTHINDHKSIRNWVDIENEYYQLLDRCSDSNCSIDALNRDFSVVKNLFIDYLKKINLTLIPKERIKNLIFERFYLKDFIQESQSKILNEVEKYLGIQFEKLNLQNDISLESRRFQKLFLEFQSNENSEIETINFLKARVDDLHTKSSIEIFKLDPKQTLFLNFNYTDSLKYYIDSRYENLVNIHGELLNKDNPVIFGFGDDVDEKYKHFENLNDNRYLENFKSIAYLQTRNYKKFLEFIDSEEYQVFIVGHSCGISDRTMLNTIFEHDNCKSIKPFYHKRENGTDNYTDIVQNISRNFNDKKKYRDRVVNKTDCEHLT